MLAQTGTFILNEAIFRVMSLSLDFFLFAGFIAFFLGFSLYKGKSRTLALLVAIHVTGALFFIFPYWGILFGTATALEVFVIKTVIFITVLLIVRMILKSIIQSSFSENKMYRWLEAVALSVVTTGVLFSYASYLLSLEDFYRFSSPLDKVFELIFTSPGALFWWIMLSLLVLHFSNKK